MHSSEYCFQLLDTEQWNLEPLCYFLAVGATVNYVIANNRKLIMCIQLPGIKQTPVGPHN